MEEVLSLFPSSLEYIEIDIIAVYTMSVLYWLWAPAWLDVSNTMDELLCVITWEKHMKC